MACDVHIPIKRAQRFSLILPLRYRGSGLSHWQNSKTINISRTGILFQTDKELPDNSILDICIEFPKYVTMECQGSVVRNEKAACAVHMHRCHLNKV
jgi:hypothetical protein